MDFERANVRPTRARNPKNQEQTGPRGRKQKGTRRQEGQDGRASDAGRPLLPGLQTDPGSDSKDRLLHGRVARAEVRRRVLAPEGRTRGDGGRRVGLGEVGRRRGRGWEGDLGGVDHVKVVLVRSLVVLLVVVRGRRRRSIVSGRWEGGRVMEDDDGRGGSGGRRRERCVARGRLDRRRRRSPVQHLVVVCRRRVKFGVSRADSSVGVDEKTDQTFPCSSCPSSSILRRAL